MGGTRQHPRMPTTRAECKGGRRPCPFVSCRYHLLIDVGRSEDPKTGKPKETIRGAIATGVRGPRREVSPTPAEMRAWAEGAAEYLCDGRETCALDVADSGPCTDAELVEFMGYSWRRIRQIESGAIAKIAAMAESDPDVGLLLKMWTGATCS